MLEENIIVAPKEPNNQTIYFSNTEVKILDFAVLLPIKI